MTTRLVRRTDLRAVTALLTRSFAEDPLFGWFFPDPATRSVLTGAWMRNSVELSMHTGHAFVSVDEAGTPVAAALWCPPDVELFDTDGFRPRWSLLVGANPTRVEELREGLGLLAAAHPHEPGHFYLNTIGVDPDRRSQGLGRPLMQRVLTVADREHVPCYLESSSELNVSFYVRHGYKVIDQIELPNGPIIRALWREPQ
ncbi:MAG: ribosomal protein S18 acetylase RimI-like enzyme [Acidimicrobiales bacterium]|jgi:ribosomal protein S18 acetylase RimI-like enzyme